MNRYIPPRKWTGRIDSHDDTRAFRWHQAVHLINMNSLGDTNTETLNICFLGFCCDEGVKRNLGRPGAAKGPQSIRVEMANWPASFLPKANLYDAGDIVCKDSNLEEAQIELSQAVQLLKSKGFFTILLGGGHEIALGHYNGLRNHALEQTEPQPVPAIINFDAHLDIRPYTDKGSSGTMFNQIYQHHHQNGLPFKYLCIGPQTYANTPYLFDLANEMGVQYILAKDLNESQLQEQKRRIIHFAKTNKNIYLTICTDVLSAAHAPGVSAVQPFGLNPDLVLDLIKEIIRTGHVSSLDIAEVSPRFDTDNRTSKLMSVMIFAIINTLMEINDYQK